MPAKNPHRLKRLTQYASYEERGTVLEQCPYCQNDQISMTPRRKGGPSMFHCKRCGYMASIDQIFGMHRLLGHVAS